MNDEGFSEWLDWCYRIVVSSAHGEDRGDQGIPTLSRLVSDPTFATFLKESFDYRVGNYLYYDYVTDRVVIARPSTRYTPPRLPFIDISDDKRNQIEMELATARESPSASQDLEAHKHFEEGVRDIHYLREEEKHLKCLAISSGELCLGLFEWYLRANRDHGDDNEAFINAAQHAGMMEQNGCLHHKCSQCLLSYINRFIRDRKHLNEATRRRFEGSWLWTLSNDHGIRLGTVNDLARLVSASDKGDDLCLRLRFGGMVQSILSRIRPPCCSFLVFRLGPILPHRHFPLGYFYGSFHRDWLNEQGQIDVETIQKCRLVFDLVGQSQLLATLLSRTTDAIGHEIKTPLFTLSGSLSLMRRNITAARTQETRDLLPLVERAQRDVEEAKTISRNLLDVTRAPRLKCELLDLVALTRRFITEYNLPSDIHCKVDTDVESLLVSVDRTRMMQVLRNICRNAVEAMPNGGVVELQIRSAGGNALLKIRDNGPGFPKSVLQNMGNPGTTTKEHWGMGLGLGIAKMLIEMHNGALRFQNNNDGGGAEVLISIPVKAGGVAYE